MKLRWLALIGVMLAAALSFTVPAAASPSAHVSQLSHITHVSALAPADTDVYTLCLNTDSTQCLNLTNCILTNDVQTYDFYSGGSCSQDWYVTVAGTVHDTFPFWCGDDLNARYQGKTVFQVIYATSTSGAYAPLSDGGGEPVYITPTLEEYYEGYWVTANNDTADTTLIDATTSCNAGGTEEYAYAGCKGNGCRVRESPDPPSLSFWAWSEFVVT